MKKSRSLVVLNLMLTLLAVSCIEIGKELSNWTQFNTIETVEGQTHFLGDDGIKIFLPNTFKAYSSIEYIKVLESLATNKESLAFEKEHLRQMRNLEGNHYIFYDESLGSTYIINTLPHTPITRQDAKYLLGIIRKNHDAISNTTHVNFKKLTAKYNDNGKVQIFKSVFKLTNDQWLGDVYQYIYFISSKEKTVMINLSLPYEVNFDPFLEKMIL